jgi:hypothetical protein
MSSSTVKVPKDLYFSKVVLGLNLIFKFTGDKLLRAILQLQATEAENTQRLIRIEEKLDSLLARPSSSNVTSESDDVDVSLLSLLPFQSMTDLESTEEKLKETPSLRNKFVSKIYLYNAPCV